MPKLFRRIPHDLHSSVLNNNIMTETNNCLHTAYFRGDQ